MKFVKHIRDQLTEKLKARDFVIDKSGSKTIELVGESFIADEISIFGTPNKDYIIKELNWYRSMSRNVYDMPNPPIIWKQIAAPHGEINSNYGWCIFSEDNGLQYQNTLRTLNKDKDSRRAIMIYTRPQMQYEFNTDGMSDFMCTNTVQYLIRNNTLIAIVNMRSNDAVFGYNNDLAWQEYVLKKLHSDLVRGNPELLIGEIHWQTGSLHVYERHFHLVAGMNRMTWDALEQGNITRTITGQRPLQPLIYQDGSLINKPLFSRDDPMGTAGITE